MMDALTAPFDDESSLVIACDNSGGIGMKEGDVVKVPYEVTAYYSFRVAVMECIAAGGTPMTVVLHNFCGDAAWAELVQGIQRGMDEIGMKLPITGSTESNMLLVQSALGLLVIGKKENSYRDIQDCSRKIAVIGKPLVGEEVMEQSQWVAPLSLFKWCTEQEDVRVLPVGSKGIAYEWKQWSSSDIPAEITSKVDVSKSSGPSTCFLVAYPEHLETALKQKCSDYFWGE